MVVVDAEESLRRCDLVRHRQAVGRLGQLFGDDQHILWRVRIGDEFENFGLVAMLFQQHCAQPIRHHLRLPLHERAMAQQEIQHAGSLRVRFHLAADLLVATRRNRDQRRTGPYPLENCVVRRRIAGVQRNDRIGTVGVIIEDRTLLETQAIKTRLDRKSTRLNSSHSRASRMPSSA